MTYLELVSAAKAVPEAPQSEGALRQKRRTLVLFCGRHYSSVSTRAATLAPTLAVTLAVTLAATLAVTLAATLAVIDEKQAPHWGALWAGS